MCRFETPVKVPADQKADLNPVCEEYLYKIIELAKESGTQLVFMASPYILSEEEQMRFNKTAEIAAQENIPMLDYNQLRDEIGLDYAVDFRDSDHVNNSGAAKVTDHLARFLTANYELTDRRGDSKYKDWDLNKQYLDDKERNKYAERAYGCRQLFTGSQYIAEPYGDSVFERELYGRREILIMMVLLHLEYVMRIIKRAVLGFLKMAFRHSI